MVGATSRLFPHPSLGPRGSHGLGLENAAAAGTPVSRCGQPRRSRSFGPKKPRAAVHVDSGILRFAGGPRGPAPENITNELGDAWRSQERGSAKSAAAPGHGKWLCVWSAQCAPGAMTMSMLACLRTTKRASRRLAQQSRLGLPSSAHKKTPFPPQNPKRYTAVPAARAGSHLRPEPACAGPAPRPA
jgi:hypothetical protein